MLDAAASGHRLETFIGGFADLIDSAHDDEATILREGRELLANLIAVDDWLPARYSQPGPGRYRQYLLHRDRRDGFCVVSFVWGPGQSTPIHDHTVWGLIGILRGSERSQRFSRMGGVLTPVGSPVDLWPGDVDAVSPTVGDIHQVSNPFQDRIGVSVHVYGADIGRVRRTAYDAAHRPTTFVSGYSNDGPPDPWPGPDPGAD